VVAPPYDVIASRLQDELYDKHPANVIRLILNRHEPEDNQLANRYTRAARFLKEWRNEGVLLADPDPAVYVYHQVFSHGGREIVRRGFIARVRLERFGEGKIYPHEETHSGPKADRLQLTVSCRSNLSPIFAIYPDEQDEAQNALEDAIQGLAPLEATDHLGVVHRMWPVNDVKVISDVSATMSPKPMYIADGHHRYETACNYRDHLQANGIQLDASHPANFVLTACVSMNDQGMIVLPTHRLLRGLSVMSSDQLAEKLDACFTLTDAGEGAELAPAVWESIEAKGDQGTIGLFAAADGRWLVASINETGRSRMAELAADHSHQWQELGVSILHRLVVETLLEVTDLPKPKYVHLAEEVVEGLTGGTSDGDRFALAALVMPATLDHVRSISEHGERMPAKSTYFYPKLLSGLVINPLE